MECRRTLVQPRGHAEFQCPCGRQIRVTDHRFRCQGCNLEVIFPHGHRRFQCPAPHCQRVNERPAGSARLASVPTVSRSAYSASAPPLAPPPPLPPPPSMAVCKSCNARLIVPEGHTKFRCQMCRAITSLKTGGEWECDVCGCSVATGLKNCRFCGHARGSQCSVFAKRAAAARSEAMVALRAQTIRTGKTEFMPIGIAVGTDRYLSGGARAGATAPGEVDVGGVAGAASAAATAATATRIYWALRITDTCRMQWLRVGPQYCEQRDAAWRLPLHRVHAVRGSDATRDTHRYLTLGSLPQQPTLSVEQLKHACAALGVSTRGAIEKSDLVDLLYGARAPLAPATGGDARGGGGSGSDTGGGAAPATAAASAPPAADAASLDDPLGGLAIEAGINATSEAAGRAAPAPALAGGAPARLAARLAADALAAARAAVAARTASAPSPAGGAATGAPPAAAPLPVFPLSWRRSQRAGGAIGALLQQPIDSLHAELRTADALYLVALPAYRAALAEATALYGAEDAERLCSTTLLLHARVQSQLFRVAGPALWVRQIVEEFGALERMTWQRADSSEVHLPTRRKTLVACGGSASAVKQQLTSIMVQPLQQKVSWFRQHVDRLKVPWEQGHIVIKVRREFLLQDAFVAVQKMSTGGVQGEAPCDFYKIWRFVFEDEEAMDAGGVAREFFSEVTNRLFNADFGLFQVGANDELAYTINPASSIANELSTEYFRFAVRNRVSSTFCPPLYTVRVPSSARPPRPAPARARFFAHRVRAVADARSRALPPACSLMLYGVHFFCLLSPLAARVVLGALHRKGAVRRPALPRGAPRPPAVRRAADCAACCVAALRVDRAALRVFGAVDRALLARAAAAAAV